ncbi:hypothetical protein [Oleiharenicola sp. Vm1]|uniref:hypothetical protein n=1 Tax=Oleiharenicola sp. Vm1 TaxID=3398393 RepID=UPI0039F517F7
MKQLGMELTVCIVDEPYIYNILATSNTLDDFTSAVTGLNKISREAQSMVSSALSSTKVVASLVNWRSLAASIDPDLKFECERAFYTDKKFREFVWTEVKRAIPPSARTGDINRFCAFFIQEVPVLADVLFTKRAIDFYPGPGTDLFFMLQKGIFSEALPKLSQLARSCTDMGYVEATKGEVAPDSSGHT